MPVEPNTLKNLFLDALDKSDLSERAAFLDQACAGDAELRRRVEALIQAHEQPDPLLDQAAAERLLASLPPEEPVADEALTFLAPPQKPGSLGRLAHYEVLELVGRGGMGVVFRAFDEKLHRVVAIKALAPGLAGSGAARQRFVREARAAAAVTHEHVIDIHAVEDAGPVPYLVMQFVDGRTLQDKLDTRGTLELREILRIGVQIAEGLAAAHRQGLIHRDIKPANILLENGVERVKITDFGLARTADDASLTQSGYVAGTPLYMSPEQARGEKVDTRTDLFSFGTVLYAMCTGHSPFRSGNSMAILKRVCEDTPRPIRESNPAIPAWLEAVIARLHAKNAADRPRSATEAATQMRRHLARLQSGEDSLELRLPPRPVPVTRRWAFWAACAMLAVALVLTAMTYFWPTRETAPTTPSSPETPVADTYMNGLGMEFQRVPRGRAWMGGHDGLGGDHEVDIPADYYLGKYEVTQEQWQQLMGTNPSAFARSGQKREAVKDVPDEELKRFPVETVSWNEVQRFVAELNRRDKVPGWTYRLPTVTQWEYALHGGPMGSPADGAAWFYFDRPTDQMLPGQANFRHDQAPNRPCKVGAHVPNKLGLHDMHGNVNEWCADACRNPYGGVGRITRGGGYGLTPEQLKSGNLGPPEGTYADLGLRLARVPVSRADPRRDDFDAWRQEVGALPAENQAAAVADLLRARNPWCNDKVTHEVSGGVLTELTVFTDNVTDLEPVQALTGLRVLRCGGSGAFRGQLADLKPLRGMALTHLDCRETLVADLKPLAGMPLVELKCDNAMVTDLTPLKSLKQLRVLTCDFRPERDVAILRSLDTLETINDKPAAEFWKEFGPK